MGCTFRLFIDRNISGVNPQWNGQGNSDHSDGLDHAALRKNPVSPDAPGAIQRPDDPNKGCMGCLASFRLILTMIQPRPPPRFNRLRIALATASLMVALALNPCV